MSTGGLPTIWELVAEGAATLPEPFSRAALINWIHARRPDVGVASIATHIQFATANAAHPDDSRPRTAAAPGRPRHLRAVPRAVGEHRPRDASPPGSC